MQIGFIGLGAMGAIIVQRLLAAGHKVTGWNRSCAKAEALIRAGMRWAATPREVAAQSEIVFSIVTDADAVKSVALGADGIIGGLKAHAIYLDMSTIAPESSRAIAAEFAKAGLIMLDAPISGSSVTLLQGSASTMVGGDKAAYQRVLPVLPAIGPNPSCEGDVVFTPRGHWHGFRNNSNADVVLAWGWSGAGSLEAAGYESVEGGRPH